jgi:hypothetical protein
VQGLSQCLRQHHHPVFATLGLTNDDHPAVKIHILDSQPQAFHQAHAGSIQQLSQQQHLSIQKAE